MDGLSWDDIVGLIANKEIPGNRWIIDWPHYIKRGWDHDAVLPHDRYNANRIEYQGYPTVPVTYFEWYEWFYGFFSSRRTDDNWLTYPQDPTQLNMQLQYGPITLWDVDQMKQARADNRELDQAYFYNAWWMAMTVVGNSISMRDGDFIIQYMGIMNPDANGERFEQWSCVNQYSPTNTHVTAQVYNYNYGSTLLTSDEVERNGDNIDYQTFYHPDYTLEGPW